MYLCDQSDWSLTAQVSQNNYNVVYTDEYIFNGTGCLWYDYGDVNRSMRTVLPDILGVCIILNLFSAYLYSWKPVKSSGFSSTKQ